MFNVIKPKIIQFQAMSNDPCWQGVILGLGDDGVIYKSEHDENGSRWNCPKCGKINWQYNQYDFDGCSDTMCDEWRSPWSSYE